MAFKLTKDELKKKSDLVARLTAAEPELTAVIFEYNEVLRDLDKFRENVMSRLRGEFDTKSENWQNSDAGSAVGEMIDAWENVDFSDLEVELGHTGALEELPEGPIS